MNVAESWEPTAGNHPTSPDCPRYIRRNIYISLPISGAEIKSLTGKDTTTDIWAVWGHFWGDSGAISEHLKGISPSHIFWYVSFEAVSDLVYKSYNTLKGSQLIQNKMKIWTV